LGLILFEFAAAGAASIFVDYLTRDITFSPVAYKSSAGLPIFSILDLTWDFGLNFVKPPRVEACTQEDRERWGGGGQRREDSIKKNQSGNPGHSGFGSP
jgi:hypothetical protein